MYKKTIIMGTVLILVGCTSDLADKLGQAAINSFKAGLTSNTTGTNSNKLTKEEYINKCTRIYADKMPNGGMKKLCTQMATMNSSKRCIMELVVKYNADSMQAGKACIRKVNTYFLRERKGKETFKSCMEENDWRIAGHGVNGLEMVQSLCREKLRNKNSKYID